MRYATTPNREPAIYMFLTHPGHPEFRAMIACYNDDVDDTLSLFMFKAAAEVCISPQFAASEDALRH